MTQWEAALAVLYCSTEAGTSRMDYKDIVDVIVGRKYCSIKTDTPERSINVAMNTRCPHKKLFKQLGDGEYAIADQVLAKRLMNDLEVKYPHRFDELRLALKPEIKISKVAIAVKDTLNNVPETKDWTSEVGDLFLEGGIERRLVNQYERKKSVRDSCLRHYGFVCWVCNFDFEKRYGEIGKGLIEVHHEEPLAQIGEEHSVDPIQDLKPVCSNCHFVIHSTIPARTIQEVKQALRPICANR